MKRFLSLLLVGCLSLGGLALGETVPVEDPEEILETIPEEEIQGEDGDEGIPEPLEEDASEEDSLTEEESDADGAEEQKEDLESPDAETIPVEGDALEAGEDEGIPEPLEGEELEEEIVEGRVLKYGDEGEDVKELQIRLQELKYYTGNTSGRYREGTEAAVKTFQSEYGLEATGIADAETQSRIFSARYRELRLGSTGDDVKSLQRRLMELGYYTQNVDGKFGKGTQNAVRDFQTNSGLEVTGVANPATQEALFTPGATGKHDVEATATPAPNMSNFLVDDNDTAVNNGVVMADEYVPFSKTLKSGSSGALVKQLQQRITDLGYYTGPVSGNFAKYTLRAVKAIQVQNGLKETGQVDEETWNVIFNDPGIVMPEATPKPTPTPTPVPFAMTVDVTNQVTTVYGRDENGEYTVPIRRMLCSTGTKANPSDVGDWVLSGRHAKWCVFPKWGNSYARYWTKINSDIAFHSVIYTAVSLDAMKTSSYKALGTRASHGCIRLTVEDAKWVYDNIGAGTVVTITEDLPSDPELRDALKLPNLKKGTSIPVETPVPTPEPDYDASEAPELGNRKLKKNSEGPEVFWVQTRLAELGYYTGYVGGKMLDGTVKAVKSFQKANSIYASGEVDQKTIDAMKAPVEIVEDVLLPETPPVPAEVTPEEALQESETPTPPPESV